MMWAKWTVFILCVVAIGITGIIAGLQDKPTVTRVEHRTVPFIRAVLTLILLFLAGALPWDMP